jgi:hypothetical protein
MFGQTRAELISNRKSQMIAIGNNKITSLMDGFYVAGINNQDQLPIEILDIYKTALAIKGAWPVKYIKAYIMREDPTAILSELNKINKNIGPNNPPDYRSLKVYITELWVASNKTEDLLTNLSIDMKNFLGEQLVTLYKIKN